MKTLLHESKKQKMLIVDDNGELRRLLKLTFGYGKYILFEAENAKAALEIMLREAPEIILLDIMMPGELDGLQLCRMIKASDNLRHCRVILLTARGQKEDFAKGEEAGADFYITKPFSPIELIEVIESKSLQK